MDGDFRGLFAGALDAIGERVSRTICPSDHMISGEAALDRYLYVGRDALRIIAGCLAFANAETPGSILDFGSGAGRVARWLRAAFPEADLTVAELRREWLDFLAAEFSAATIESSSEIADLEFGKSFDVIWVGSVVTHLDEVDAECLIRKLHAALNPKGILVFSSHGRRMIRNQLRGRPVYIEPGRFATIMAQCIARNYGFSPHVDGQRTGISLTNVDWFARWCAAAPDRFLLGYFEAAWDDHHDIVAIRKQAA